VKPNVDGAPIPNAGGASVHADVRGIVIVSTWRGCSASRAVTESSLVVVDCLLGQYNDFLQFAGQKDGATRYAQIEQLLLANHVDHDVSDHLVAVQFDASNAFFSVVMQPQFDVLASKASRSYDDGRVQVDDELPRPRTLDKYWGHFLSMQGNVFTKRYSDNQGVTHHLPCSKGGQQGDGLETIRFAVTVHPSIGRVCERHLDCKVVGICDNIFIITCLSKALSCAAEMKNILKADLDMDLNVPKFNVFFLDTSFSLDTARFALESVVRADPALEDLAAMGAGVETDVMRVAGVPVGVDAWVKTFVAKKAQSVITDIAKLDVVSDGFLHNQLLNFCQNARMVFLGRNTPTPLLSEFMTQVDDTVVEAVYSHGTGGGHVDWSPHLRKFAIMKIQVPHFRGGFGITPNEGSTISAFYSATCALVVWCVRVFVRVCACANEFHKSTRDLKARSPVKEHSNEVRGGGRDSGVERPGAGPGQSPARSKFVRSFHF